MIESELAGAIIALVIWFGFWIPCMYLLAKGLYDYNQSWKR